MSSRISIPPKLVREEPTIQLDFASAIAGTATLVSATATATVFSGVDPSPSAIIDTVTVTAASTLCAIKLLGGIAGCVYDVEVSATDTDGNILTIGFYLAVTATPT